MTLPSTVQFQAIRHSKIKDTLDSSIPSKHFLYLAKWDQKMKKFATLHWSLQSFYKCCLFQTERCLEIMENLQEKRSYNCLCMM